MKLKLKLRWVERVVTVLVVLAAAIVFVKQCRRLEQPVCDDAAITLAYARTFFGGGGARLTFASARVEGFSDALWMVIVGWAFPLHLDPIRWAQRLSTTCGVLTVVASAFFGPAVHGRHLRLEDAVAPALLCCFPLFAYWATSGMETTLYAFLLTASVLVVVREERTGRGSWAGLWLSLLFLTRPEAPLAVAAAFFYWIIARVGGTRPRKRPGKQELFIVAWLLVVCGGYLLVRWWYFARLVPNTYFAKRWWDYHASDYLRIFCQTYTAMVTVLALSWLLVSTFGSARERRVLALLVLVLGGGVFFVIVSKGDWMNEFRFTAPYCGIAAMLFAAAIGVCRRQGGLVRTVGALVVAGVAFTAVYRESKPHLAELKDVHNFPAEGVREVQGESLEKLRNDLGLVQGRFAIPDVGGSSLYLAHDAIVDVAGLTDYAIAEHSLKREGQEDYLLNEGMPDLIDAHGQSQYVTSFHELMKNYTPYRDGSSYVLRDLTKDADPRCPDGMPSVRDASPGGFEERLNAALDGGNPGLAVALWRCGEQHRPAAAMPTDASRRRLAERAEASARSERDSLKRLRWFSLATILSREDAHLRRTTERLRERLRDRHELPGLTKLAE